MAEKYRLIGLTGTNSAGKGEVAAYLGKKGYAYFSLSDLIREELRKTGKKATRDNLIAAGNALRRRYGPDILARRVMKKVKGKAVIDSIRNTREAAFLRKQKGFVLVAVNAPVELRYERAKKRGRPESAGSLEEFIAKEKVEMAAGADGQQLRRCLALADVTLMNDGTLAELHRQIGELL
ncbi:MAG: AAA family ATPase [Acidobacteriota bacterium]